MIEQMRSINTFDPIVLNTIYVFQMWGLGSIIATTTIMKFDIVNFFVIFLFECSVQ